MERRIEVDEPREVRTIDPTGVVQAMQFFKESEQFSTRSCVRCDGLLVNDWCYDLDNTGEHIASLFRCVQCGHRIDPVILQNQIHHLQSGCQPHSEGRFDLNEYTHRSTADLPKRRYPWIM